MYIADFILGYWGGLIFRIKFFPEFFLKIELLAINKGYVPPPGTPGVTTGVWGGTGVCLVCHALLMNSFFSLCTVATDTFVSFDVTLML